MDFYQEKFPQGNQFLVLRSLVYFEDAQEEMEGIELKDFDWEQIKTFIVKERNKIL